MNSFLVSFYFQLLFKIEDIFLSEIWDVFMLIKLV